MKLAANSRSPGRYSWKKVGVAPAWWITSSIGVWEKVESVNGTPVAADARAAATSPLKSGAQSPTRPMGHMKIGDARRSPKISIGQITLWRADHHSRYDSVAGIRCDVGSLSLPDPGSCRHISVHPVRERLGRLPLD